MTDRELLEAAAKAAGIAKPTGQGGYVSEDGAFVFYLDCEGKTARVWNPLTDDGDALRLAVKLDLLAGPDFWHERSIQAAMDAFSGDRQDPYAATRRAIVRAAASLGERGKT